MGGSVTRWWDNATSLQQEDKGLTSVYEKGVLTASRCGHLRYQLLEACGSFTLPNVPSAIGGRSWRPRNGGYNKIKKSNYKKKKCLPELGKQVGRVEHAPLVHHSLYAWLRCATRGRLSNRDDRGWFRSFSWWGARLA